MILIILAILSLPTAYELYVERKGEAMKSKKWSMFTRVVIALGSTWVAAVFKNDDLVPDLVKCGLMAFAIFFLTFDYLFNIIFHRKERVWYSYLSESQIDSVWGKVNWKWRMAVRGIVFIGALIIFYS